MGSRDLNSVYLISAQCFDHLCDLSQQLSSSTVRMLAQVALQRAEQAHAPAYAPTL